MTSDRKLRASREGPKGRNVKGLESETRSLSVEKSGPWLEPFPVRKSLNSLGYFLPDCERFGEKGLVFGPFG